MSDKDFFITLDEARAALECYDDMTIREDGTRIPPVAEWRPIVNALRAFVEEHSPQPEEAEPVGWPDLGTAVAHMPELQAFVVEKMVLEQQQAEALLELDAKLAKVERKAKNRFAEITKLNKELRSIREYAKLGAFSHYHARLAVDMDECAKILGVRREHVVGALQTAAVAAGRTPEGKAAARCPATNFVSECNRPCLGAECMMLMEGHRSAAQVATIRGLIERRRALGFTAGTANQTLDAIQYALDADKDPG